jgi:hypothetical protein
MFSNFLSESKEEELQTFLNWLFILAKNNIEEKLNLSDLNKFTEFTPFLNFWTNFSLNFKDQSFVEEVKKNKKNIELINKILAKVVVIFENSLTNFGKFKLL